MAPSQSGMTQARPIGLQFRETMRGYFSTEVHDDYQRAAERGKQDNSPFEFTLTVTSGVRWDADGGASCPGAVEEDPSPQAAITSTTKIVPILPATLHESCIIRMFACYGHQIRSRPAYPDRPRTSVRVRQCR